MNFLNKSFLVLSLAGWSPLTTAAVKVSGQVSGIQTRNNDDIVNGALVIPSLRASDLLNFSIDKFLAPSEDLSAGPTTVKVPGNLYFPKQKETYGIFPVNLSKESFTLMLEPGEQDELVSIAFSAPFKKLVSSAQNHASYDQLIGLASFDSFEVSSSRNWAQESNITLGIGRKLTKTNSFSWTRPDDPNPNNLDLAFAVQKTLNKRWTITDLLMHPKASGQLSSGEALNPEMKVFLMHLENDDHHNPIAFQAWVVSTSVGQVIDVQGAPSRLTPTLANQQDLSWPVPAHDIGWVGLVRSANKNSAASNAEQELAFSPFSGLSFRLDQLFNKTTVQFEGWVDVKLGKANLSAPLSAKESLTVIFVSTTHPVPAPLPSEENPELFDAAQSVSMIRL